MQREKDKGAKQRVEFGNEFGDFNAAKAYEIRHMTKQSPDKKEKTRGCGGL
ncbi:MAG TPA: hypothetical protein VNM69_03240 [Bacillus sp. (in: firmicutes)]|uniref:hypothetical protein n=1 Tax=Bacillus litorisediminis TaxID=2922713 RepID=UPI001FACB6C9|nr:hypothetical protein [Bacillus litorisediminis]HWO74916.1 hypothetical protein [Bacillus sp. (in: firmicutes)]